MRYATVEINTGDTVTSCVVPVDFGRVLQWLVGERLSHQASKWDYGPIDLERALQGLDEDSWFWQRGVENYVGRVRLFGVTHPLGVQALLKLVATLASMPEHLLRGGVIPELPRPGLSSGNL